MDKQMIEDMKKDIADRMDMAKGVAGSMNNGVEGWLAEYLIEKGWAKIPEGAVVLTREEYEILKVKDKEKHWLETCMSIWKNAKIDARKETAEEFAERLKADCTWRNNYDSEGVSHPYTILDIEELDEICKEITEGGK